MVVKPAWLRQHQSFHLPQAKVCQLFVLHSQTILHTRLNKVGEPAAIMSDTVDIAVVSFDKFLHGGDEAKRGVARQLYDAFSTVGWVYLKDHGIPQERVDEIFSLVRGEGFI